MANRAHGGDLQHDWEISGEACERDLETPYIGRNKLPILDHPDNNIVKFTEFKTVAIFDGKGGYEVQGNFKCSMRVSSGNT